MTKAAELVEAQWIGRRSPTMLSRRSTGAGSARIIHSSAFSAKSVGAPVSWVLSRTVNPL